MILVVLLGVVLALLAAAAARRPGLARIAWRQAAGHPGQSVLIIGGLMLGGAALTASLVAVDSAQRLATRIELLRWGATDVTVTADRPFPIELADLIAADPDVRQAAKAVVPELALGARLSDISTQRTETLATLIGYDPARDAALGDFELVGGRRLRGADAKSILLNERAAGRLGARPGDTVAVTLTSTGESVSLAVRGIVRMTGKAAWGLDSAGFVSLPVAQKVARAPGAVNLLRVIAPADPLHAVSALDDALARGGLPLHARAAKRDGLAAAASQTRLLRYALVAMSMFLLAAGIVLIVNLVVMLAEERARHLGILRALGMRRGSLVLIGALEGATYSIAAGAVGSALGIGFGFLLARALQDAFQRRFLPGASLPLVFHARASAVLFGFAGGALVALLTMIVAWRRTSRLNVTAAIRGTAPTAAHQPVAHSGALAVLRVAGIAVAVAALSSGSVAVKTVSILVAAGFGASFLRRRLSERTRLSILSLALLLWALVTGRTVAVDDARTFMQALVLLNLVVVFALSLLVAANLGALERGAAFLGRWSAGARQTLRPVLAYLALRPLRTGLSVSVFGLVLSLAAAATSVLASGRHPTDEGPRGFHVVATTFGPNAVDLRASADVATVRPVRFRIYRGPVSFPGGRIAHLTTTVYEATPALSDLPLAERDPKLKSDREAWRRVVTGGGGIGSFGPLGQPLDFEASNTTVVNTGFLRARSLLLGTVVGPAQFGDIPGEIGTQYLIRAKPGVDPSLLVRSLEKTWFADGLDASTALALVDRGQEDLRAFLAIIEFMTRLALGIGVLALGIIGLRAAVERRRMLGTLRALGYRRRTVGLALLAEAVLVTTAGTVVGAGSGLLLNGVLLGRGLSGADPGRLAGLVALTYVLGLIVAVGPALRAARVPPAEAIRTID